MSAPDYAAHIAALRGLYRKPDAETLRRELARQADVTAAAMAEAANRPTPERLEQLAWHLDGARKLALACREAMQSETDKGGDHADA